MLSTLDIRIIKLKACVMVAIIGSLANNQKNLTGTTLPQTRSDTFDKMLISAREDLTPTEKRDSQTNIPTRKEDSSDKAHLDEKTTDKQEIENAQSNEKPNDTSSINFSVEKDIELPESLLLASAFEEITTTQNTEEDSDDNIDSDLSDSQVATFIAPQLTLEQAKTVDSENPDELSDIDADNPQNSKKDEINTIENSSSDNTKKPDGKFEISENDFEISPKQETINKDTAIQYNKPQTQDSQFDTSTNQQAAISSNASDKAKSNNKSSDAIGPLKIQVNDVTSEAHNSGTNEEFDLNKDQTQEQILDLKSENPKAEFVTAEENEIAINASNNITQRTESTKIDASETETFKDVQNIRNQALDAVKIVHNSPVAKTVTITLSPANLGHMTITLDIDPTTQTSRINFTITNSKTYEMMLSTQETLRQELKEVVNISESSLQFNLKEGNGEENQSQKNAWHTELKDFAAEEDDQILRVTPNTASDSYTALDDLEGGISRLV